jgi:AcrB/AcrD/AcrF family
MEAGVVPSKRGAGKESHNENSTLMKTVAALTIGAAFPLGAIAAPPSKMMTERGVIEKVDGARKAFALKGEHLKRTAIFEWNASTRFVENGKLATASELKTGERATVNYARHGNSIIILGALGQTLNIMTPGGLALAVGILVDDATVEVENIHRNLGEGKPIVRAILDGAQQIAVPAFVSTLCICIVFVLVFFLSGVARFLFRPLAMAVIFAMLASYFLSRTVVPTMVKFLLKAHAHDGPHEIVLLRTHSRKLQRRR